MTQERETAENPTQNPLEPRRSMRQREITAIRAARSLSQEIMLDPIKVSLIVETYRASILSDEGLLTLEEIGEAVVPEGEHIPNVKANAVRLVIDACMDPEENFQIRRTRHTQFAERRIREMGEKAVAARMERARSEHIRKIKSGETKVNDKGIVEGMGHTRWTDSETTVLKLTTDSSEFRFQDGPHRGQPNWDKIAKFINDVFHQGQPVRSRQSLVHRYHGHKSTPRRKSSSGIEEE